MTVPFTPDIMAGTLPAAAPRAGVPYVLATIGARQVAAPMAALLEVADLGEITSLPLTPAWLLGVCNLHGVVVPVIDLAAMLEWEGSRPGRRALVLRDGQFGLAVAVDSVPAVRWLEQPPDAAADEHSLVEQVAIDGRQTYVMAPDALVARVRTGNQVGTGGR